MKPKHYTDEELEKMLKDLPPIEDRQSKQDIYRKISPNLNQSNRKIAPWIMPGMATAAVILLLAIVIPVFLNMDNSNQFEQSTSDQETSQSDSQSDSTMESAEMPREKTTINNEPQKSEQTNLEEGSSEDSTPSEEAETHVAEDENIQTAELNEAKVDTGALPDKNAQIVIPYTIVYKDGGSEKKSQFEPNKYGLSESLLSEAKIEIDEQAKEANIIFPDNFRVNGSSWADMLVESIRWRVEPFEVEKINLKSENGSGVTIGPYGELKEVPTIKNGEYYFQSYQPPSSHTRLLAPMKANGIISIKAALIEMKHDKNLDFISPAVPDHVHFQSISEEDDRLMINLTHGEWKDEQEVLTTVDAILMTARQYGFKEVDFNGIQFQPFPAYDLSEPIKVPEQINPIFITK